MKNPQLEKIKQILIQKAETEENPKMVEIFVDGKTYQNAFCFALGLSSPEGRYSKLLTAVIAGADSTLQSMKAAIQMGTYGFSFGYGEKGLNAYKFNSELSIFTEKGKYSFFPMSVNNKKAMALVHDDILNGHYVLSFDRNPAEDIRSVLGGKQFGLPILEEWSETILEEMYARSYITEMPIYYDHNLFPDGISLLQMSLTEEEADNLLSDLIKSKKIKFPEEGTGEELENVENLTDYMTAFSDSMLQKISSTLKPTHNPLQDDVYEYFDTYATKLFPVQGHVATGIAKRLLKQKAIILQGEMSVGKSKMMTAIADGYMKMKGHNGFHAILMVPPSLTDKWSNEEIYDLLPSPRSKVIHVKSTKDLIDYHQAWLNAGKPKPEVPTFFVVSFTTMRSDAAIEPATHFQYIKTKKQKVDNTLPYRFGYYCPDCGKAHQITESKNVEINEDGEEIVTYQKKTMEEEEWGNSRRISDSVKPANAFCSECGASLWKRAVPTRYRSFKEWAAYEKKLLEAIKTGDKFEIQRIRKNQPEIPKMQGKPRRVAVIEYIRRKMKNFFDVAIIDEIHELKGGGTAQGNALGSLAAASKRVIAGTGTLFGGKALDIFYLMWRLFAPDMVKAGYKYSEVTKWNYEFGNVEKTTYSRDNNDTEYTNKQSRGGLKPPSEKVLPGISPFVFGKFLIQNTVLVRLLDVWPDPVELVDVPTIFCEMTEDMKEHYHDMKMTFEKEIDKNIGKEDGFNNLWLLYTDTGIAYPDNPFRYPVVTAKDKFGEEHVIWEPTHLSEEIITPKEQKLIEIAQGELAENRPLIIYVRDTGSTKEARDIQPRLKKILEEQVKGSKVAILRSNTTKTDQRSHWLKKKVEQEGYNIIIVSMELVKVGLDLLCTPTIIFYQFSWSMFTMAQASKRAWRIGQHRECRLYYLAYKDTFQEHMAQIIAMKNKASRAINGEVSTDGLNAMLGDEGDLQSLLIKSIQNGEKLQGSTEEWIATTTDRAREILSNIGKAKKPSANDLIVQLINWARSKSLEESTIDTIRSKQETIISRLNNNEIFGFSVKNGQLKIDTILAFGFDYFADADLIDHLLGSEVKPVGMKNIKFEVRIIEENNKRKGVPKGQLALDLFG